jgi:uncharacterized protein YutE (UPF0331/DUF86 family)
MTNLPIEREAILPRIDGIRRNLKRLEALSKLPLQEFAQGDAYDLVQHHLRLALEGVFHISSHLLSRLPGARAVEYKEVARKMGEFKLVPKSFADKALVAMAGMRNILVHAYSDIKPEKLYEIVRDHCGDINIFLNHVKAVVQDPGKYGLTLE